MMKDDRAVTETMGYILLFSIVLTAIALILLFGNSILNNEKDNNNFHSIEQGFTIIQSDMQQVALEGTPNKTTMIHMNGGSILSNTSTGKLKIDYNATHYDNYTGHIIFMSPSDLSTISIENGGVWEKGNENGTDVLISKPRFYITPQSHTLVLNIIRINAMPLSNAGIATLTIQMMYNTTYVYTDSMVGGGPVAITMDTQYPNAWKRYLEDTIGPVVNVGYTAMPDGSSKFTISNVDKLIISEHIIDARFG